MTTMSDLLQLGIVLAVIAAAALYLVVRRLRRPARLCDRCPDQPARSRLVQIGRRPTSDR